jgi:hypothetical protein
VPISSDAIASLFGVAQPHGVGQTQDAARMALRLPALCGVPTREEAAQVLEVSVARQHDLTRRVTAWTKQRREGLSHPERLERVGLHQEQPHVERRARSKNRSNDNAIVKRSITDEKRYGPQLASPDEPLIIENTGPPDISKTALTS